MEVLDPDAVLAWQQTNMSLETAFARLDRFIAIGASGWSSPGLLAALQIVRAAAATALPLETNNPD